MKRLKQGLESHFADRGMKVLMPENGELVSLKFQGQEVAKVPPQSVPPHVDWIRMFPFFFF